MTDIIEFPLMQKEMDTVPLTAKESAKEYIDTLGNKDSFLVISCSHEEGAVGCESNMIDDEMLVVMDKLKFLILNDMFGK